MVLESRLKAVIEWFLGDFIDSDKLDLSVNLWQAENLRVENVHIKPDILPTSVPFRFKVAHIGELRAHIPFSTLSTASVKVVLSDVLIVLAPRLWDAKDESEEVAALAAEKCAALEKDLEHRQNGPGEEPITEGYFGTDGFVGRLVSRLLDNLQVEVKNIHVRFEGADPTMANNGHEGRFAIGASLDAFFAETTDNHWTTSGWNPESSGLNTHIVFKLIQFMNLTLYVDPNALHYIHTSIHPRVLKSTISKLRILADKTTNPEWWTIDPALHPHRFIIAPISGTMKLTMNTAARQAETEQPRYKVDWELTKLTSAVDEEQIALVMKLIDGINEHYVWRDRIAERLELIKKQNLTPQNTARYLELWSEVSQTSRKQMKALRKKPLWKELTELEEKLPLKYIIKLRNRGGYRMVEPVSPRSILFEVGEVFGVPIPEVTVVYTDKDRNREGVLDFGLTFQRNKRREIVVKQCFEGGVSAKKGVIKEGFVVVRANHHMITPETSVRDLTVMLANLGNDRESTAIPITFRHPEVQEDVVTVNQTVSSIRLTLADFEVNLVSGRARKVILNAMLHEFCVEIEGHGPGLFSYDYYEFKCQDFYLQDSFSDAKTVVNSCVLSSISRDETCSDALFLSINMLSMDHPSVQIEDLRTFATKVDCRFGGIVLVYEKDKICEVLGGIQRFMDCALAPISKHEVPLSSLLDIPEPMSSVSLMSESTISTETPGSCASWSGINTNAETKQLLVDASSNTTFALTIERLKFFVTVPDEEKRNAQSVSSASPEHSSTEASQRESYRNILGQLKLQDVGETTPILLRRQISKDPCSAYGSDYDTVVRSIVKFQNILRGYLVRKHALPKQRHIDPENGERHGWLYERDDSLAFRRWNRFFFNIASDGKLYKYANGSGTSFLGAIDLRSIVDLQHAVHVKGPFGFCSANMEMETTTPERDACVFSIVTVDRVYFLAGSSFGNTEKWMNSIILKREIIDMEREEGHFDSELDENITDQTPRVDLFTSSNDYSAINSHLHFTNVFQTRSEKNERFNNSTPMKWISFDLKSFVLGLSMHSGATQDEFCHVLDITASSLGMWDYSSHTKHGILRLGNTFLDFKRGKLHTVAMNPNANKMLKQNKLQLTSDVVREDENLFISMSFCGVHGTPSYAHIRPGVLLDISFNGWILPLDVISVFMSTLDELSLLWTSTENDSTLHAQNSGALDTSPPPIDVADNNGNNTNGPLEVDSLTIRINPQVFEVYIEEMSCVAKLSMEKCMISYNAIKEKETASLSIGPSALFVLTEDVQLRLVKIAKVNVDYELSVREDVNEGLIGQKLYNRRLNVRLGVIKFEADRRMKLLFAFLETFSSSDTENNPLNGDEDEDSELVELMHQPEYSTFSTIPEDQPQHQRVSREGRARRSRNVSGSGSGSVHYSRSPVSDSNSRPPPTSLHKRASLSRSRKGRKNVGGSTSSVSHGAANNGASLSMHSVTPSLVSAAMLSPDFLDDMSEPTTSGTSTTVDNVLMGPLLLMQAVVTIRENHESRSGGGGWFYDSHIPKGTIVDFATFSCSEVVFEVIKRTLSMVALDTYIPVIKISVSRFICEVETSDELERNYRINTGVEVYARYYNTSLADWEPVVEPWHIHAEISKGMDESSGTVIRLKAMERLNINFTQALVKLICSVYTSKRKNAARVERTQKPDGSSKELQKSIFALAADAEASKETGRVCVLNSLGVPVRLANLNTSTTGILTVEIRDGWSLPSYSRFHDVRVEVMLLPWWNPYEVQDLSTLYHKFNLRYDGAQPGVAPKLRIRLSVRRIPGTPFIYGEEGPAQTDGNSESLFDERDVMEAEDQLDDIASRASTSTAVAEAYWVCMGTSEIDLVGKLSGAKYATKEWFRLRNKDGRLSGEVLLAIRFVPTMDTPTRQQEARERENSPAVHDGSYLLFDPLRVGGSRQKCSESGMESTTNNDTTGTATMMKHMLPGHVRDNYVPPVALEVVIDGETRSLLCPLRRAGKFLITGQNGVLVEVKIAQRDESRRVVLLSSPFQFKNETNLDVSLWSCPTYNRLDDPDPMMVSIVKPKEKKSIALNAFYGTERHVLMIQVQNSLPTLLTLDDKSISGGAHLLYLPSNHPENQSWGYCFYVEIIAQVRNVYSDQQYEVVGSEGAAKRSNLNSLEVVESRGQATKYHFRLHACLAFENTLPVRVQYEILTGKGAAMRAGTLSPGEEVHFYEFEPQAIIQLRLPTMDSDWCRPFHLSHCIAQDGKKLGTKRTTVPDQPEMRREDLTVKFYRKQEISPGLVYSEKQSQLFTGRLDYTVSDNGGPRVVLYASIWLYNQTHIPELVFRDSDVEKGSTTSAKRMLRTYNTPTLMDCPSQSIEMAAVNDNETSIWSDEIHATAPVGVQGGVTLMCGNKAHVSRRWDIGLAIYRPLGRFHRSVQVVLTPRYVFANHTPIEYELRQVSSKTGYTRGYPTYILAPGGRTNIADKVTEFDFSGLFTASVAIRPKIANARWSGPFTLEEEKEFPLRIRGCPSLWKNARQTVEEQNMQRVRIRVRLVGATIVASISEDLMPMFIIRNKSSFLLHVRQSYTSRRRTDIIKSNSQTPFAWDKPDGHRQVVGEFHDAFDPTKKRVSTASRFDFEQLEKDRGIIILWLGGNKTKVISSQIIVEGASRVLEFTDQANTLPTTYILEVNIIALRRNAASISRIDDSENVISDAVSYVEVVPPLGQPSRRTVEAKLLFHHLYRYDSKAVFEFYDRPREINLFFFEYENPYTGNHRVMSNSSQSDSISILSTSPRRHDTAHNIDVQAGQTRQMIISPPLSPMDRVSGSYSKIDDPSDMEEGSHSSAEESKFVKRRRHGPSFEGYEEQGEDKEEDSQRYDMESDEEEEEEEEEQEYSIPREATGFVHIKLPRKAWKNINKGMDRSISDIQGYWWDLVSSKSGAVMGQIQVALRFRRASNSISTKGDGVDEQSEHKDESMWIRGMIPSIGISFVHNTNLIEVAYFSLQRVHFLWSQSNESNEIALAIGNIQIDNQMEEEVVLGTTLSSTRKEGVSIRLRDRWKSCLNYGNRGIYEQVDNSSINVLQFRVLWNAASSAGITHVELVELIVQELEMATDEKFVVNLISVFQGLEKISSHQSFEDIVDQSVNYLEKSVSTSENIYIEQLDLESIRLKFSLELNGGRHIATLGPSGRRLAVYLPESNVKNLRLYFSRLMFQHVYGPQDRIVNSLYRHYQQQAVIIVLRGLYTVTLFVNPFRIVYRLGHGFLAVVKLPARGLASGSPVELLSGAYLGVRSLAVNTISASYETVAGISGFMTTVIGAILPESKKKSFMEDMIGFQRTVMDEVDTLDTAEERHMTRATIRKPRTFSSSGIGLITEYGPGALPMQEQLVVDFKAAVAIQRWWRRRKLAQELLAAAEKIRPRVEQEEHKLCIIS